MPLRESHETPESNGLNAGSAAIVLSLSGAQTLPAPLDAWVRQGLLRVVHVSTIHAAAAAVKTEDRAAIVLVNPNEISSTTAATMPALVKRSPVPVVLLPAGETPRNSAKLRACGAISWQEAGPVLAAILVDTSAIQNVSETAAEAASDTSLTITTDNSELANAAVPDENAVTSLIAARYDELDHRPVLSEEEMQALLGMAE